MLRELEPELVKDRGGAYLKLRWEELISDERGVAHHSIESLAAFYHVLDCPTEEVLGANSQLRELKLLRASSGFTRLFFVEFKTC